MSSWAVKQKLSTWNPRRTRVYNTWVPSLHFFFLICFCRFFLLCFSDCRSAHSDLPSVFQIFLLSPNLFFSSSDLHFPDRSSSSFGSGSSVLQIVFIFMRFPDCVFQILSSDLRFPDHSSSFFGSSSSVLQIVFIFIFVLQILL